MESPNAFRCIQNVLYGSTIYSFKDPDKHTHTHALSSALPYHANTLAESGIVSAIGKQNSLSLSLPPLSVSLSRTQAHINTQINTHRGTHMLSQRVARDERDG